MADEETQHKKLTPIDIHDQQFKRRGRHGYDRLEVDTFLDQIVDDYGDTLDENSDLKNRNLSLDKENQQLKAEIEHYYQQEQKLQAADQIKEQAQQRAQMELDQAKRQKAVLQAEYEHLKRQVTNFRHDWQAKLEQEAANLNDADWQQRLKQHEAQEEGSLVDSNGSDDVNSKLVMQKTAPQEESASSKNGATVVFPDNYAKNN